MRPDGFACDDDLAEFSERRMVAYHLIAMAIIALVWLYGPSNALPVAPENLQTLPKIDGTLVSVSERRLVIAPLGEDRGAPRELSIRYEDAYNFDVAHLRGHAALGLPTRVFYERSGDGDYAVWKEDAPVNSAGATRG